MEKVMRAFKVDKVPYHGGTFYSASSLKKYRWCNVGKWSECKADQDFISREILASKIMWHVTEDMKQYFDNLQEDPTRQLWKACIENFQSKLQEHTRGIFGDYSMKIALDGVLLSQPCLERVVSCWPMRCPAYENALPMLYPNCRKNRTDLYLAGCHYHKCLKAFFPKFHLRDSLAELCWMGRYAS